MKKTLKDVDAYIVATPEDVKGQLKKLRVAIREVVPNTVERINYGIPHYDYKRRLAYFRFTKTHIGLYIPPPVIERHKSELKNYDIAISL